MLSPHPRSALSQTSALVSRGTPASLVRLSLLVAGGAAGLACGKVSDTVAIDALSTASGSGAEGGSSADGGTSADGKGGATAAGAQCGDSYPELTWPTGSGRRVCTPSLARERMSHALCSCGDVAAWGGVQTDAFDSATQAAAPGASAVGINGAYVSPSPLWGGGSVTIAATTTLAIPLLDVRGDLRLAGGLDVAGPLTVGRNAWFAESAEAGLLTAIVGDVHQVPGKTLGEAIAGGTRGGLFADEFSVAPPCRCDETQISDWTSIIESASQENDNVSMGLNATDLMQPADAVTLTLACGRYYVSGIESAQEIHLRVVGRVALFVAGNVSSTGPLRMKLDPNAELDLFIGGELTFPGADRGEDVPPAVELGDAARPAATRIYVGGDGPLSVPQENVFANLYAPRADVNLDGKSPFSGSVFGHTVTGANIAVHYDVAVQRVADGCALDEPATCSGCGQCSAGRACVAGSCAACTTDADCCWPLVCDEGGRCTAFQE